MANKIEDFDKMTETLKSHYTYLTYNPYTGVNDIKITAKKRFLNNVLTNMWPYMLQEMEKEKDWDKWSELWSRQFKVFNYLLDFVSRDNSQAKRVERRVRKEKKPERMVRIILNHLEDVYTSEK